MLNMENEDCKKYILYAVYENKMSLLEGFWKHTIQIKSPRIKLNAHLGNTICRGGPKENVRTLDQR